MAAAVEAMGGREAIDSIKNLHTAMSMDMQGMAFKMESFWAREGGQMSKSSTPMGEMTMGTDGTVYWMKGATGYVLMPEDQKKNLRDQSSVFMRFLDPEKMLTETLESIESKGKVTFGEKECWQLHYKDKDGEEGELFYDVASGMPAGFESIEKQGETLIRSRGIMGDWKEQDGVKFFHTMTMTSEAQPGMTMVMKVDTIEVNKLDEKTFALPEEVKKLVESKPGDAAAKKEIKLEDLTPEQQKMAKETLDGLKQNPDPAERKALVQRLKMAIPMIQDANQRVPIEWAVQELEKELAKAGG